MTIDQEIVELRAELSGSILTQDERAEIETALAEAMQRRDRRDDEVELMLLAALESDEAEEFGIDPDFDDLRHARELAFA